MNRGYKLIIEMATKDGLRFVHYDTPAGDAMPQEYVDYIERLENKAIDVTSEGSD
jgi:hypothetical protein